MNNLPPMDHFFQSIFSLQELLREAGVPSIVIGGLAVAAWGEPRLTRDVDLKILLNRQEADRLFEILTDSYHPLIENPREALQKQAMLFVQDIRGTRLDLLLADSPYDGVAIKRRCNIEVEPGIFIDFCSPEDLIIYKIISTRLRDHEDARSVILRQGSNLDDEYIIKWLRQFEAALDDSNLVSQFSDFRSQS